MQSELLTWGLLGIDDITSLRRTRTLGLGSAVRKFNDLAVPGMGNVRFIKQIYLSLLGIQVTELANKKAKLKLRNIEVTNAIEAFACMRTFTTYGWNSDPRLRGINKLRKIISEPTYANLRKAGVYVTQPLRMGTVQALPALDLVSTDSNLFNHFTLNERGEALVNLLSNRYQTATASIAECFVKWIEGHQIPKNSNLIETISPTMPIDTKQLKIVRKVITSYGAEQDKKRRESILSWADSLENKTQNSWALKPFEIKDDDHWRDLQAGGLFFKTRDAVLELLNSLEEYLDRKHSRIIELKETSDILKKEKTKVIRAANDFLRFRYDPTERNEASIFCTDCSDLRTIIKNVVLRDGVGLQLIGDKIRAGYAFKGLSAVSNKEAEAGDFDNTAVVGKFPEFISGRVINMFYLNQDLKGKLNNWFNNG